MKTSALISATATAGARSNRAAFSWLRFSMSEMGENFRIPRKTQGSVLLGSQIRDGSRALGVILTAVLSLTDAAQLGSAWAATPQQADSSSINEVFRRAQERHRHQMAQAQALINQANNLIQQGDVDEAVKLWERVVEILDGQLESDDPDIAKALNALAALYKDQGKHEKASLLYERALAIREKVLGSGHLDTAVSLNNLALVYSELGRHEDAGSLYKRALLIREKTLGPEHPSTAAIFNNLAVLYHELGRYGDAELLHKRALLIRTKVLGLEHPDTAISINNLAVLYDSRGRYRDAEEFYKLALLISQKKPGLEHPDTANILSNLAVVYDNQGRYRDAEPLYRRALLIREKALGPEHPLTATSLNNLAASYDSQARRADAEPLYKRLLMIIEKTLGPEHPSTARILGNLAARHSDHGRYEDAESLYKRALLIREKALGPEHPDTVTSLSDLAALHLQRGRSETPLPLLTRLNRSQAEWLRRELPLQPRDLRQSQLQAQPDAVAITFALLHQDPSAAPLALETRLNRQGLLAEIEQRQRLLLDSSAETRSLGERLGGLDRQLASVTLKPGQREQLRAERQQLEAELNRRLPALRIDPVSTDQVAVALRQLAAAGLLVEFQRYRPYLRSSGGGGEWGSPRYVALLLKPDGTIRTIPLGEAEPIDAAITAAVAASADPARQQQASEALARVSQLLLTPLQPQLAGVKELFLSPDGELNRLPFSALPMPGPGGQLLAEAVALRLLTTGRELLRLQQPGGVGGSAVLMANPAFDAPATDASARSAALPATAASVGSAGGQRRSAGLRGRAWQRLPGTAAEARQLSPLLQVSQPLTGREATAAAALRQQGPRIFHIATHGFFEADQQQGDPLLRSGLVFAGANQPDADPADDGYLTAAEATGMKLEGTELVTLSACETGLGDVRSGEGVYGLQRSLAVAGARSTLLSLWQVDDELTTLFMEQFYRRLMAGQSRADALRDTQRAFRSESLESLVSMGASGQDGGKQRGSLAVVAAEKGSGPAVAKHNSVYVWGAFQLSGDWRPLPR